MLFVTVGTHEQPFDRLVREIDRLKGHGIIEGEVVVQIGFSTYEPENCRWSRWFSYEEMCRYIREAEIVLTHGGPASFIAPLRIGKIPIVVPRQKKYGEHVNDHQVEFCKAVKERLGNIILVEEVSGIENTIRDYQNNGYAAKRGIGGGNVRFNEEFEKIVKEMVLSKMQ